MDEIDQQIIECLRENGRIPFKKIAQKLGIATNTVILRYKKLKKKVLPTSSIIINMKKLGFNAIATFYLKLASKDYQQQIYKNIIKIPNALVVGRFVGAYDVAVHFPLRNFEDLFDIRKALEKIEGISEIDFGLREIWPTYPINVHVPNIRHASNKTEKTNAK